MISTVSLSFDLTYTNPQGIVVPRCVVTDSTDYATIGINTSNTQAKGYGVLTFNGDVVQQKNSALTPLIDLEAGDTTGFFDLPLDLNGNVANGVYGISYSLRLNGVGFQFLTIPSPYTIITDGDSWLADFLVSGNEIELVSGVTNYPQVVASATEVAPNASITTSTPINGAITYDYYQFDIANEQFSATYSYSGCTQVSADVNFIYDCEYGDSGTWSVANTTALGSNEIVSSLSCVVSYPSWTAVDQSFNPQVLITSLPYPTTPSLTPLATGTYTVSLSQQIQQTQASGLVVIYNNSVIKEFAVTCAGTLCGLVPCIENLRAAHATELIRNRISKYQVFVDNVLLYYTEAMNYRSCGELDKYRETLTLLQAQLDASGCECACCDDETYYWVSNNSATSVIDELLANFQYRLFSTGMGDPGDTQAGVEYGAIWQNTNTGVLYRCIDATATALIWEEYYNPIGGATNGLSVVSGNIVLGGPLDNDTTVDLGVDDLTFSATSGNLVFSGIGGNVAFSSVVGSALVLEGTTNALDVLSTTNTAAILKVERAADNTVATNLTLRTSVNGGTPGNDGLGSSIQFTSESATSSIATTASIESVLTTASSPTEGNLKFNTKSTAGLVNTLTLNPDSSATLPFYGDGNYVATPTYYLGVDVDGNVVENGASNGLSISSGGIVLGGSLDAATTIDLSTQDLTFSDGNVLFSGTGTQKVTLSSTSNTLQVTGGVGAVSIDGTTNALDVTSTTNTAARLTVNTPTNNTAATNLSLRTTVDGGSGDDGVGSSIQFATESSAGIPVTTASIESVLVSATSPVQANLNFKTRSSSSSSLLDRLTLNSDGSVTLPSYGDGAITGTATRSLSVDVDGNVIETAPAPKVYLALVNQSGTGNPTVTVVQNTTGETVTWDYVSVGTYNAIITGNLFAAGKTVVTASLGGYAAFAYNGALVSVAGQRTSNSNVQILSFGAPTGGTGPELANGILTTATIRIEIYP